MGARTWKRRTVMLPWSDDLVVIVGYVDGLPAIPWGWADRDVLATRRQLHARGLTPGRLDPAAVLVFQHRMPARSVEYADLFLIAHAAQRRSATPAQRAAAAKARAARRTCQRCGHEQDYYPSAASRMCAPCEDATNFWPNRAAQHGWSWAA